jgi:hypothetical protein
MFTPREERIEATSDVPDRCIPATTMGDRSRVIAVGLLALS